MANVTSVDRDEQTVDLAHCTVPLDLVTSYDIMSHFETSKSVGIRGRIEEGPVTLVKVHGLGLERYWVATGRITANLTDENACRTQIRVKLDGSVDYFLKASLANHHVVIPGDHKDRLKRFFWFSAEAI
jgi:L-fucose isomerase-like protein